jgi:hypothetical protein
VTLGEGGDGLPEMDMSNAIVAIWRARTSDVKVVGPIMVVGG